MEKEKEINCKMKEWKDIKSLPLVRVYSYANCASHVPSVYCSSQRHYRNDGNVFLQHVKESDSVSARVCGGLAVYIGRSVTVPEGRQV